MAPTFEIHVENWNSALHIGNRGHFSGLRWLINLLNEYKVNPKIYYLKDDYNFYWESIDASNTTHEVGSHGVHHYYDEKADRSPYFNQEGIPFPPSGGFFFRVLPLWYVRWAIKKSGIFWIHPHDLDEEHPKLKNPLMN
jgi:Domain of unknown function (DUF3473).